MLPKVDERRPGRQGTANDSGGDTRKQNLLTMCNSPDARRPVNVRSTIISVRFAGVNSHSNAQRNMGWPRFQAKSALNRTSRRDRRFAELAGRIGLPALSTLNFRLLTTSSQLLAPS